MIRYHTQIDIRIRIFDPRDGGDSSSKWRKTVVETPRKESNIYICNIGEIRKYRKECIAISCNESSTRVMGIIEWIPHRKYDSNIIEYILGIHQARKQEILNLFHW
jgi:hypothetical protein